MLRMFQTRALRQLGSFRPPLLSRHERGLHWAPRQGFLPESEVARMKRLLMNQYDKERQSTSQYYWIQFKYLIKASVHLVVMGTKQFIRDFKWRWHLFFDPVKKREMTGWEVREMTRTNWDFTKFVPFFILLAAPGGELILPIYIYLLPNGNPSYFTYDLMYHKDSLDNNIRRGKAYEFLYSKFTKKVVPSHNKEALLDPDQSQELFTKNRAVIERQLHFHKFSSDNLMMVSDLLGMKPITGTLIINKIVNLFTLYIPRMFYKLFRALKYRNRKPPAYKDPKWIKGDFKFLKLNYFPFEFIKRQLLIFQIERHLTRVAREDSAFEANGFRELTKERIAPFMRDRGLTILTCYKAAINFYIEDWIYQTNSPQFTNNMRLWYAVMMHSFLKENPDFYVEDE